MVLIMIIVSFPVFAEPPLAVDDAGTLPARGKKVELFYGRSNGTRLEEVGVGMALKGGLEVGVGVDREVAQEREIKGHGAGISLKWVPQQRERGLSTGLLVTRSRLHHAALADAQHHRYHDFEVRGLLTWRTTVGAVHGNAGFSKRISEGMRFLWGIAGEWPFSRELSVLGQYFGEEGGTPVFGGGVRWSVNERIKMGIIANRKTGREREGFWLLSFTAEF
ncbi:MAG: hypothetical protein N2557_06485 [Hydrogenophilus sp.]|nr:hypothetical protein [Hydrogenophilus sp.]